jgi:hypothetical protein
MLSALRRNPVRNASDSAGGEPVILSQSNRAGDYRWAARCRLARHEPRAGHFAGGVTAADLATGELQLAPLHDPHFDEMA